MLKVVVYSSGRGGEDVATFLENELGVIEVIRVIDWAKSDALDGSDSLDGSDFALEVERAEYNLARFLGKVDVIVWADYASCGICEELKQRYPQQKFVQIKISHKKIKRRKFRNEPILFLTTENLCRDVLRQELEDAYQGAMGILPDCQHWARLIDNGLMIAEVIADDLAKYFIIKPPKDVFERRVKLSVTLPLGRRMAFKRAQSLFDAAIERLERLNQERNDARKAYLETFEGREPVMTWANKTNVNLREKVQPYAIVLLDARLWAWRSEIEEIFGWQVQVIDFRRKLLRDTCLALGLLGVDGRPGVFE